MAKSLNKRRVRDSWIVAVSAIAIYAFSRGLYPDESSLHEVNEYTGYFFVIFCAFGRIYCTAFIGGKKNEALMTSGPFSICRNPLYFCSTIGVLGIALMSNRFSAIAMMLLFFVPTYYFMIKREEVFLLEKFGEEYRAYMARVPRFLPKFSLYEEPAEITLRPKFIRNAMRDAFVWFTPYPVFELIEYVQELGWLPKLFLLP